MTATHPDTRKYLDPKVLARISSLEIRARMAVEGFFAGMHHSPHRGLSVEFADHRIYTQGDDLRHIDWKVFGKTDKYYIKEYEQETNLEIMLVVDCSESMAFRSSPELMTKYEYATSVAGAIAYLALQQQDSVGLAMFNERLTYFLKPHNNPHHWRTIIHELDGKTGPAKTSTGRVLAEITERLRHRVMLILISDLFDDSEVILKSLKLLRFHHHEIIVWNLWDPAELQFPYHGPTLFEGLEDSGRLLAEPGALRQRYLEEVARFQDRLRLGCGHMHVEFTLFNTSMALDAALSGYLATRGARLRSRSSRSAGGR